MRIALLAAGSRGDYQPALAVADALRSRGHEVGVTATSDFADEVRAQGFAVEEVRLDVMRTYREETSGQMPADIPGQLALLGAFAGTAAPAIAATMEDLWPRYDAVVSTALTLSWACTLAAVDPRPHATMLFVPALPTGWGDASMLSVEPGWSTRNLAAGWRAAGSGASLLRASVGAAQRQLTPAQRARAARLMVSTPTLVAHSAQVVAPRRIAGRRVEVTGYPFRRLPQDAHLAPGLRDFLAAGPPPVYAGFGSQGVGATRDALRHSVTAAVQAGHRVVLLRGTGGEDELATDRVLVVDGVHHELLFPRCRVIVHHGGAGTTAQALRSGTPQVVVPFALDQPFFGRRCHEIGVAGPPVPVPAATPDRLAASIALAGSAAVRETAYRVGERVRTEEGAQQTADRLEQHLLRDQDRVGARGRPGDPRRTLTR